MSTNRLANETSPYLLQHAHNPVDWYPWGEEAFARARAEDKPILLSVGYSACHWCHVMERESFENPDIAGADEPPLRQHQGRSRGAAGRRSHLHAGRAVDDRPRRLADDRVPHARRHAVLRRHVLPAAGPSRPAGLPAAARRRSPTPGSRGAARSCSPGAQLTESLGQTDRLRRAATLLDARRSSSPRSRASSAQFDEEWGGLGGAPKFPQPMIWEFVLRFWQAHAEPLRASAWFTRR